MHFKLLGPLEYHVEDRQVPLGGINQRALLGALLINANQVVATSRLTKALWGYDAPSTSRKMVQNAASSVRRIFTENGASNSPAELLTRSPGYLLSVPCESIDLYMFQQLAEQGRAELIRRRWESATRSLREALALWRGPMLSDLAEMGIDWPELRATQSARLAAFEDCVEAELAIGRHHELANELEAAFAAEPARERLCGHLMLALYRCGRQPDALMVYQRTRTALLAEFGLDPGRELQQLERAILNHDPSLALPAPAAPSLSRAIPEAVADVREEPVRATPRVTAAGAARTLSERKWISVLMVQACFGTPRDAEDPEYVDDALKDLAAAITEGVKIFGGVVHARVGSVWWVLFGAGRTREDDPERAVRAALALRERFSPRPSASPTTGSHPVVHSAVATGEVICTYGDRAEAYPVDVVGPVLETCARLLVRVPPGSVQVCADTGRVTRHAFDFSEENEPSEKQRATAPAAVTDTSALTPFVGRRAELNSLQRLLESIRIRNQPHLVTLLGEPGIGKSRLVTELMIADSKAPEAVRWLIGRVPPYGRNITLGALADIVKSCAGIRDFDPAALAERQLAAAVREVCGSSDRADWIISRLRPVIGLGETDHFRNPRHGHNPAESFTAWRTFMEEIAARQPLAVVLEDLHLADDALLDFVGDLTDDVGSVPLLVIATSRPELLQTRPLWGGGKRNATTLTLDPLPTDSLALLLESLAQRHCPEKRADRNRPQAARRCGPEDGEAYGGPALISRIGGNPLFADEYVRMLAGPAPPTGRVPSVEGSFLDTTGHGGPAGQLHPLPQPVYTVIAARLDNLPPAEREVLRDAAVLSGTVWARAVAALGERDEAEVLACLERLERMEFLRRVRDGSATDDVTYEFRHVLVRDVAYAQLTRSARGTKHLRAAAWMERLSPAHEELRAYHSAEASGLSAADGRTIAGVVERRPEPLTQPV
ncbi:AAA family ATPase [Streptomyces parvus]|uniref:AAA family ATPase n=1 Tax=Streptomyces parvus TaxID=66428 RepID=A0A5D4JPP1_9ACTN|nr:AAA family ATPase [Streptomyces parvus]